MLLSSKEAGTPAAIQLSPSIRAPHIWLSATRNLWKALNNSWMTTAIAPPLPWGAQHPPKISLWIMEALWHAGLLFYTTAEIQDCRGSDSQTLKLETKSATAGVLSNMGHDVPECSLPADFHHTSVCMSLSKEPCLIAFALLALLEVP